MTETGGHQPTNSQRVAYSTSIQLVGRLATSALGIVTLGTVTRALSPDAFGQFAAATIFIGLLSTFTDAGLGTATVREIASGSRTTNDILGITILLRFAISVIVVVIGIGFGMFIYRGHAHASTRQAMLLLSVTVLIATLQSSVTAGLVAVLRHDLIVVGDILGRAVTLTIIVAAARRDLGYTAVIVAYVVGAAVNALCDLAFGLHRFRPRLRADLAYMRQILRIALPLGGSGVLNIVYLRADGFMLSIMRTNTEVARYGVAYKAVEFTLALPAFFASAALPILVRAHNDPERVRAIGRRCFDTMGSLAAPITFGAIAVSPEIARVLGGSAYSSAALPMSILMAGTYFGYFSSVLGVVMIAADAQARFFRIFLITLVVNVVLNLAVIPRFGTTGAACAVVVAELLALVLLHRVCVEIGAKVSGWLDQVRPLACAAVMGAVMIALKPIVRPHIPGNFSLLLAMTAVGVAVYGLSGTATRALPFAQLRELVRPPVTAQNKA